MKIIILFLALIIVLLALLILTILRYRRETALFSRELEDTLDEMIAWEEGQTYPDFEFTSDTLSGKINIKLKRLFEILYQKNEQSKRDRDRLYSLISDISHQTKTPIANLKLYYQILSERKLEENKRKEFLDLSLAQAEKLEFLVSALVKMSRLENGLISFSTERTQAVLIVADSLAQIMPFAEKKGISITVDCSEDIFVCCDKKWTCEALFNVLDNAVKYTPENGSISVSVRKNKFYVIIKVKDSGIGIPEAEQAKIFGRFYRSEVVKNVEGIGIGLFLTRQILSGQNGFIVVKSEQNSGSEFMINIPAE